MQAAPNRRHAIGTKANLKKLTVLDAFSGIGGMSRGASQAGFAVAAAIEIDANAVKTYRMNHRGVHVINKDIRNVDVLEIRRALKGRALDALIGCAPCQGFCSLTSKHKREDPRNTLVLEMARLARDLRPRVVVMENVPGLLTRGKLLFNELLSQLSDAGYKLSWDIVQMADFGVPQNRRRLVLIGAREFVPSLPVPTHSRDPSGSSSRVARWKTVRDAIRGMKPPITLSAAMEGDGPIALNWHVVRNLKPATKARLKAAMPGESRLALDADLLPQCHKNGYSGFRNVYTRMSWDAPSPTITAGCLTPAKGRFGHPDRRRTTISVREAARIQTFEDDFQFHTDQIDVACQMIGNAVPPMFARALFSHIHSQLMSAKEGS
jgi:DNA (cytosine-5)-methyltransferase 1